MGSLRARVTACGIDAAAAEELLRALRRAAAPPVEPMLAVVAEARNAGLRVGALTNDMLREEEEQEQPEPHEPHQHKEHLQQQERHGLAPAFLAALPFHAVVRSSRAGRRKPEPAAYAAALAALGVAEGSAVVFVADLAPNLRGAARAGMNTFLVDHARPGAAPRGAGAFPTRQSADGQCFL